MKKMIMALFVSLALTPLFAAQETIKLPAPDMKGGKPLMECLALRQSNRTFSDKALSPQQISNLLWAAFGVNRADGKRTAPTAHNCQDTLIYVAMKEGLYLYDAKQNELKLILAEDIRANCGKQDFHKIAPVDLIFVSDLKKIAGKNEEKTFYSANHAGYVSQNVYLYCASEGLSTVVCAWVDKAKLAKAMKLPEGQKILLTQPVAFPQ